jgi:succinoglycan biosynthesis transport protein ExoP
MNDAALTIFDESGRRLQLMSSDGFGHPAAEADEAKFDLRTLWAIVYRNRALFLAAIALSLAGGLAVTMLTTPIYRAVASIQIDQQSARVLQQQDIDAEEPQQDVDRFLQTQLDVLRSRTLAEKVAQSLGLYRGNRFLVAMGERVDGGDSVQGQRHRVVSLLQANMDVALPRSSRVANIMFNSPDPALAARVANSFADNFIISNLQRKYDASSYARSFLQQQLGETKRRLEEAERSSIAYARTARLIDASSGSGSDSTGATGPRSLVTSSLVQTNSSLSTAISARIAAQQRWAQAQATPAMSLPEVQTNTAIQALVQQRAVAQAGYEEQRSRRKDDFPAMRQAAAQIAELDRQIATLAGLARNSIRDQYLIATRQEQSIRQDLARLQGETFSEQDRSVRLNILRREVDTSRTLYDGLLQRYKEVSAAAGIAANNIAVVDRADVPGVPILPRPVLNIAIAVLLGVAASVILMFARETFDDAIRSSEDIDRKLRVPFLGSVPMLGPNDTPQDALADARSAFSEAYYAARSALEFSTSTGLPRTLLLTSSLQGEGKSTTSTALAQSFARVGKRVLLIDSDLRKPSISRLVNLPNQRGFSNVLTRQATIDEVIQHSDTPNLDVVTSGPLPPNPAELLATASIKTILDELVRRYDIVLIDGPPVMGLADSPLLSALVEGVVFVVEASRAHRGNAKIALRRLRASRGIIVGAVLTKFDARAMGYGADYGYSYNYGSGPAQSVNFPSSGWKRLFHRKGGSEDATRPKEEVD